MNNEIKALRQELQRTRKELLYYKMESDIAKEKLQDPDKYFAKIIKDVTKKADEMALKRLEKLEAEAHMLQESITNLKEFYKK